MPGTIVQSDLGTHPSRPSIIMRWCQCFHTGYLRIMILAVISQPIQASYYVHKNTITGWIKSTLYMH